MSITSNDQQSTDSLNGKLTFEQDKNRIVGRDEDNKIGLLIGTDPFVVKIAKDGFDVLTAGNDDLIFNSSQNVFKIITSYTLILPAMSLNTGGANYAVGTPQTISTPHGLSAVPAILAFWAAGSDYIPLPWTTSGQFGSGGFSYVERYAYATPTVVGVSGAISGYNINTTQPTTTIKIFVLQETVS